MSESKIVTIERMLLDFMRARDNILKNLINAKVALYQTSFNWDHIRPHLANIESLFGLTWDVFSHITSEIGTYKEIAPEAYEFLKDDLDRAVKISMNISKGPMTFRKPRVI